MFPIINTPKISEIIYKLIKEKIVSKEFPPGSRLDLDDIEIQLGVSRTPLKEALNRLQMEGLVSILPRSGTYVTDPKKEDISDSFELRRILEISAVEFAVKNAGDKDLQDLRNLVEEMHLLAKSEDISSNYPQYLELDHTFHGKLVLLSGNKRLVEVHSRENLHSQMARIRYSRFEPELYLTQEEHERILDALEHRDTKSAMNEISSHLKRAKRSLLTDMDNFKNNKIKPVEIHK
jgi:GntR family transcriptional regulator, rspAB operon transcriptional repressor